MTVDSTIGSQRWAELSSLYHKARQLKSDEAFEIRKLAVNMRLNLAASCGCGLEKIYHYNYTFGYAPEMDVSKQVLHPHEALTETDSGWATGLGIQLEIGPDTYPKQIIIWPINIVYDAETGAMMLTSHIFQGEEKISQKNYKTDVERITERMFEGLKTSLCNWASGGTPPSSIGFG